jgi:glycosyltransferase involved in cell wall biosynthesis
MHSTHLVLEIFAWLIALAWLGKFFEAARGLPTIPNLARPEHDRTPASEPTLTVIVPACNEAPNIAACLESLLAQDYANLQIIAIDDRSTDQTGAILDTLAQAHTNNLTALHVTELPANWLGKTHAMALAARHAIAQHKPDYLLFTDADIIFHPEILRRSLAQAVATNADHFVTMPTTLVKSTGEGMFLSFLQVIGLWAVRPWRVATPSRRDAIGVGAFNLIRTSAYLQLGGFDAIPMEILEDLTLGRRVKRAGLQQRVATAPEMVAVHWAAGLFGIVNNMTKNMFALFRFRSVLLLGAATWFALFCIAPVVSLAFPVTRIPAIVTLAAVSGLYLLSSRTSHISPWNAVLAPISATLIIYSMLRSMVVTLRDGGVTWRGTFYPLAELRKSARRTADS